MSFFEDFLLYGLIGFFTIDLLLVLSNFRPNLGPAMIRGGLENPPPSIASVVLTASRRPHCVPASTPLDCGAPLCIIANL